MTDWLSELEKIAPPPPVEQRGPIPAPADWEAVEVSLGLRLPADFKAFVARYGGDASLEGEYFYYSPLSRLKALRLPRATERALWAYEEMRAVSPRRFSMAAFPEPGAFLPVGVTGNGDHFGWRIGEGPPETWRTAWLADEEGAAELYDMSITQWLFRLARGEIRGAALRPPEAPPLRFHPPRG